MTDDELLAELTRVAAAADPPPELVVASARHALSTRRLDDQLAALLADSALDTAVQVVRGDDQPRLLSFAHADTTIDLQIQRTAGGLAVRGLVASTASEVVVDASEAVVDASDGPHAAPLDESGWFTVADLPDGPLRVRLPGRPTGGISTGWIAP
ncbi:hypothetical protein AAH979_30260 [Plantactinospora sp. ZYX-F-223]|uniref:hypothetical protein n=1 Tax=Plantactinospora sp. ZYX-F-223 TaxID=3144103 RepID=UPI0031FD6D84